MCLRLELFFRASPHKWVGSNEGRATGVYNTQHYIFPAWWTGALSVRTPYHPGLYPPMQEGKWPISDPTILTDTHPDPEEDAGLVPSVRHNLAGAAYFPNGFSQVAMMELRIEPTTPWSGCGNYPTLPLCHSNLQSEDTYGSINSYTRTRTPREF